MVGGRYEDRCQLPVVGIWWMVVVAMDGRSCYEARPISR